MMKTAFFTVLGVSLLMLVAYDVYATILHARARSGPIGETLNRTLWRATRFFAFRLSRLRRHKLLNAVGPLLLPALIVVYIMMLLVGFALIYYPRMPAQFTVQTTVATTPGWTESLYFSGITLTTVGYGDIAPHSAMMRTAALVEAACGLALISLAITYLITVYGALEHKRAVALSFYHQAEEGANVAGFIAHHFVGGKFYGLEAVLRQAARDIQALLESHVEHPVIHYFHPLEVYKSLPRVMFLALETCAVIRSCLDREEYKELCDHPEVRTLEASAFHVLHDLVASLDLERRARRRRESPFEEGRRWKRRFQETMQQLTERNIKTMPDEDAAWQHYYQRREDWEAQLHRFSRHLGYHWDEITGDRDLLYAADEEMEQPRSDAETQGHGDAETRRKS
ncbi:MAG TPA: ion channel [Pyrinomonadaceae bacterium]|nr:ion channel [Pyrinomonadaceae bacterium]